MPVFLLGYSPQSWIARARLSWPISRRKLELQRDLRCRSQYRSVAGLCYRHLTFWWHDPVRRDLAVGGHPKSNGAGLVRRGHVRSEHSGDVDAAGIARRRREPLIRSLR